MEGGDQRLEKKYSTPEKLGQEAKCPVPVDRPLRWDTVCHWKIVAHGRVVGGTGAREDKGGSRDQNHAQRRSSWCYEWRGEKTVALQQS